MVEQDKVPIFRVVPCLLNDATTGRSYQTPD
jgi:hypothetical protein